MNSVKTSTPTPKTIVRSRRKNRYQATFDNTMSRHTYQKEKEKQKPYKDNMYE